MSKKGTISPFLFADRRKSCSKRHLKNIILLNIDLCASRILPFATPNFLCLELSESCLFLTLELFVLQIFVIYWIKMQFLCCFFVQCLLLYFASADYRTWMSWKKKKRLTSTYFQYISAKFTLFWFWPQPIRRYETDIQKWLWPGLFVASYMHMGI